MNGDSLCNPLLGRVMEGSEKRSPEERLQKIKHIVEAELIRKYGDFQVTDDTATIAEPHARWLRNLLEICKCP